MTLLLEIAQQSASGTLGDLWDDVYIAKGFRTVHCITLTRVERLA